MRLVLFPVLLPLFWREMQVGLAAVLLACSSYMISCGCKTVHWAFNTTNRMRCCCLLQNGYAWWETLAVMTTQVALCLFNCWFLFASWMRRR
jgi:hypothetical protein